MGDISAHLDSSEVRCHCGCGFGLEADDFAQNTALAFEQIRKLCSHLLGRDCALRVNSGCRCNIENIRVGGKPNSRHLSGDALDIHCPDGIPYETFFQFCDTVIDDMGGVGKYVKKNFVHIDTRGFRARWEG